jgi:hypothetical protein
MVATLSCEKEDGTTISRDSIDDPSDDSPFRQLQTEAKLIVLDAIALATTVLMLVAGGLGLFFTPRHHDRTELLARSWKRR